MCTTVTGIRVDNLSFARIAFVRFSEMNFLIQKSTNSLICAYEKKTYSLTTNEAVATEVNNESTTKWKKMPATNTLKSEFTFEIPLRTDLIMFPIEMSLNGNRNAAKILLPTNQFEKLSINLLSIDRSMPSTF